MFMVFVAVSGVPRSPLELHDSHIPWCDSRKVYAYLIFLLPLGCEDLESTCNWAGGLYSTDLIGAGSVPRPALRLWMCRRRHGGEELHFVLRTCPGTCAIQIHSAEPFEKHCDLYRLQILRSGDVGAPKIFRIRVRSRHEALSFMQSFAICADFLLRSMQGSFPVTLFNLCLCF